MSKVYAVGYSLGSMFTYEIACQLNHRFAAIASFTGTMPVNPNSCFMSNNISILHIHGELDNIISYHNGWVWKDWDSVGIMMDVPSLVSFWEDRYNFQQYTKISLSSDTEHFIYDLCDSGVRVEHYRINKHGHGWPVVINSEPTVRVMWNFLFEGRIY